MDVTHLSIQIRDVNFGNQVQIVEPVNMYECTIGDETKIGPFVEVQSDVVIGKNVIISSHSFICSYVTIEDDVFVGHGVVTINDVHPPSKRRTGTSEQWKKTCIKKGAVIGSNATLFPVTIGKNAIVGAGAVVIQDVPDNAVVVGNPARVIKYNT